MIKKGLVRAIATIGLALGIVLATNSPALASGSFENNQTTMIIRDNGVYVGTVEVAVWTMNRPRQQVKARVWAAGFSGWTKVEAVPSFTTYRGWVRVNRTLPVGSRICAEGFLDGVSSGLPCAIIQR